MQDEVSLSDWKQQLERDIETMKAQSNTVNIRSVSPVISNDHCTYHLLLDSVASSAFVS